MTYISTPSPNFNERDISVPLNMVVLHYTGMLSCQAALERLCDPKSEVSSHYLVDINGDTYKLVDEKSRAWHAGKSFWNGISDVNSASIGIELVNLGHELGYKPFPEEQMKALEDLLKNITSRHTIPLYNFIGHSDIAPGRKIDPGELFNWKRLAQNNFGLWPDKAASNKMKTFQKIEEMETIAGMLHHYGYIKAEDKDQLTLIIKEFQRHFIPTSITGQFDQKTQATLETLLTLKNQKLTFTM